jgi:hypothetical protein
MGILSLLLGLAISLAGPQEVSRKEALGGFEINRIMVHNLLIPMPDSSTYRREGRNPEIIKIEVRGSADALRSFFATAMAEFKWKPVRDFGSRFCWTQVQPNNASIETVCVNIPEDGKATLSVKSVGDAK